jgi:hypothetical protein
VATEPLVTIAPSMPACAFMPVLLEPTVVTLSLSIVADPSTAVARMPGATLPSVATVTLVIDTSPPVPAIIVARP